MRFIAFSCLSKGSLEQVTFLGKCSRVEIHIPLCWMQQLKLGTRSSWHQSSNQETSSISLAYTSQASHSTGIWSYSFQRYKVCERAFSSATAHPGTQQPCAVPCSKSGISSLLWQADCAVHHASAY